VIHATDPKMRETIKRTVQPCFVLQGNVCALLAAKDHVNLFLALDAGTTRETGATGLEPAFPDRRGSVAAPTPTAVGAQRESPR
jgi:hypothetical protein